MVKIKELRQERNLSLRDLAADLEIAYSSLGKYERGDQQPSFETLIKLADYFNVTTDYLIGRSEGKTPELQTLYEEIRLSEASIDLLKSMAEFISQYKGGPFEKMSPLNCIDFLLSQKEQSYRLFDCIYAYFLAHIEEGQQIFISKDGTLRLIPDFEAGNCIYQSIPSEYLESSILQEISEQLKEFKKLYQEHK